MRLVDLLGSCGFYLQWSTWLSSILAIVEIVGNASPNPKPKMVSYPYRRAVIPTVEGRVVIRPRARH